MKGNGKIYAIGYQQRKVEDIVEIVKEKGISHVVDVRSVPYSRDQSYNKNRLSDVFGNQYVWLGKVLGGKTGPAKQEGIERLLIALREKELVLLLMCMENHPCDCHRLTDISRRLLERGIDVIHIFDGEEKLTSELTEDLCNERKKQKRKK
jgi:uncharacterized protein (DUF488 family)